MANLAVIRVFSDLSDTELSGVDELIHWYAASKQTVLISNQDQSDEVFFVAEGTVRATTYSFSGKEVSYQDLHAGEMFGELSAIDGKPRTTSIVCLTDATIGKISSADFWKLMEMYPSVMRKVMHRLAGLIRFLVGRVYEYSAMDVKDRIRAEIIRHARENMTGENSAVIEDMETHEEIANRITTHREAVTKEFSYLVKHGYIEKRGRIIIVPDFAKFCDLIDEDI